MDEVPAVRPIDPTTVNAADVDRVCAGCIIKMKDGRILLQQRSVGRSFAHFLGLFGGGLDEGETPEECMVRELYEEIELRVAPGAATLLGAVLEQASTDAPRGLLLYVYFYHDAEGALGDACHEDFRAYYDKAEGALSHPLVPGDARWGLEECLRRGLVQ